MSYRNFTLKNSWKIGEKSTLHSYTSTCQETEWGSYDFEDLLLAKLPWGRDKMLALFPMAAEMSKAMTEKSWTLPSLCGTALSRNRGYLVLLVPQSLGWVTLWWLASVETNFSVGKYSQTLYLWTPYPKTQLRDKKKCQENLGSLLSMCRLLFLSLLPK